MTTLGLGGSTALSVPHPLAFVAALMAPGSDQRSQSGYVASFRSDIAKEALLAGGLARCAAGVRVLRRRPTSW